MMNQQNTMNHLHDCKCLSWKPIFAGALAAIGFTFLLNLFSIALGLTAFTTNSDGVETLVMGGFLGIAIGIIVAMFASGWLAGYLGNRHCNKRHLGALYGFLTWCVALVGAMLLAGFIQNYISIYSSFISGPSVHALQVSGGAAAGGVAVNVNSNDHATTTNIVISSYILFSLFFLSAFASSLGGHCGMRHVCKEDGTC